jgi:hypothetical protein
MADEDLTARFGHCPPLCFLSIFDRPPSSEGQPIFVIRNRLDELVVHRFGKNRINAICVDGPNDAGECFIVNFDRVEAIIIGLAGYPIQQKQYLLLRFGKWLRRQLIKMVAVDIRPILAFGTTSDRVT